MNEESRRVGLQPIYPQHLGGYEQQEEINLVDLWIALLEFKRVFLSSLVAFIVLGAIAVTLLITPKYTMSTVLGIARYNDGTIEPPAAVVNRINVLILPALSKKIILDNDMEVFETKVNNPKGTNLVVIENKVTKENGALFAEFQKEIGLLVIRAHRNLLHDFNADLRRKISLEQGVGELNSLSFSNYVNKYQAGIQNSIQLINGRVNELTENNNSIQSQANQSKNAALPLLVQMSDNNQKIADLITKQLMLEQELSIKFSEFNESVKKKEKVIIDLEKQIQTELTRISGSGELSLKPEGLSQDKAYLIVIGLSVFLAFGVTLIAMFRAKVIKRLAMET